MTSEITHFWRAEGAPGQNDVFFRARLRRARFLKVFWTVKVSISPLETAILVKIFARRRRAVIFFAF